MSGLVIDREMCIGCGRCLRACGSGGIELKGEGRARRAFPTDGCILCGACIDACPVNAISIEKAATADEAQLAAYQGIWVFVQTDAEGSVMPVAFELVGRARELAAERGEDYRVTALLPAAESVSADDATASLIASGADAVIRCCDERFASPDAAVTAAWIADLAASRKPEIILYGATAFGRELAPAVAVRLQTGLTADCTVLGIDSATGLLQQTRPAFGGNLMATIACPAHRPQMATVRPGIFAAPEPDSGRRGSVEDVALDSAATPRVRRLVAAATDDTPSITEADVLVVVGRGIGSKKNLPLMRRLAAALGGELGCTRPIVEAGWLPYRHQVGQTGVSVAPKLLISVGVSGAIQHLAGIGGAQTIVAINEDPDAPIFGAAHYKVVGDCTEAVAALVDQLEER